MIDDSLVKALGSVTAEYAFLERSLQFATWTFLFGNNLRGQPFGQAVTAQLSFRQLADLFSSSCRLAFPGVDDTALKNLCKRIDAAAEKRNTTLHSLWLGGFDGQAVRLRTTARRTLKHDTAHASVADVLAIAAEISETAQAVTAFFLGLLEPTAPEAPQPGA